MRKVNSIKPPLEKLLHWLTTFKAYESSKSLQEKTEKALNEATSDRDKVKADAKAVEERVNATAAERDAAKAAAPKSLNDAQSANTPAQCGIVNRMENGLSSGKDIFARITQDFPIKLPRFSRLRLLFGLCNIDTTS